MKYIYFAGTYMLDTYINRMIRDSFEAIDREYEGYDPYNHVGSKVSGGTCSA